MIWIIPAILVWLCLVALVAMQPDDAINTEPDRPRGLMRQAGLIILALSSPERD